MTKMTTGTNCWRKKAPTIASSPISQMLVVLGPKKLANPHGDSKGEK